MFKNIQFILHKPQLSENIGACARAMKNFNFSNLVVVNPKPTYPNDKIIATSVGASDVIRQSKCYKNLEKINSFIYKEFEKRNLPLKKIYFSENYDEGYDSMRKPGIGMFVKAKEDFNINLSKSLMIGDSIVDMQVGDRLDMKTIFLLTGMGKDYLDEVKSTCSIIS